MAAFSRKLLRSNEKIGLFSHKDKKYMYQKSKVEAFNLKMVVRACCCEAASLTAILVFCNDEIIHENDFQSTNYQPNLQLCVL